MTDETQGEGQAPAEDTTHAQTEAEATGAQDTPGEDAAAEPAPAPKPKQSAQERIDELTAARRTAERDAEYWREKALQAPTPQPPAPRAPEGDGKPDPASFSEGTYDPEYVEALADWKATQTVTRVLGQHQREQSVNAQVASFQERAAQTFPDGESEGMQAFRRIPTLPQGVQDILLSSEQGPRLAEHLGANPGELQRLSGLTPALQGHELAKLEARLSAPKPKTATTAPEPPPTNRGQGGQFKPSADTDDFAAFERSYGSN